jgi:hypothetical protein
LLNIQIEEDFNRPDISVQREATRPRTSAFRTEGESAQAPRICRNITSGPWNDDRYYPLARQFFYEQVQKA